MMVFRILVILFFGSVFCLPAETQDEDQVIEPVTKTVFSRTFGDDQPLSLLGVAPRSRYFIKVYVLGLYVDAESFGKLVRSHELNNKAIAEALVEAPMRKALLFKFVRDISAERIRDTLRKGIERSVSTDDPQTADDIARYMEKITDYKKGETMTFIFQVDGTMIASGKDNTDEVVTNTLLVRALLDYYLGPDPVDEEIKLKLVQFRSSIESENTVEKTEISKPEGF